MPKVPDLGSVILFLTRNYAEIFLDVERYQYFVAPWRTKERIDNTRKPSHTPYDHPDLIDPGDGWNGREEDEVDGEENQVSSDSCVSPRYGFSGRLHAKTVPSPSRITCFAERPLRRELESTRRRLETPIRGHRHGDSSPKRPHQLATVADRDRHDARRKIGLHEVHGSTRG